MLALVNVLHINGELERRSLLVLLQQRHEKRGNESASEINTRIESHLCMHDTTSSEKYMCRKDNQKAVALLG